MLVFEQFSDLLPLGEARVALDALDEKNQLTIAMLATGQSCYTIAGGLYLAERTVGSRKDKISKILGTGEKSELTVLAHASGWYEDIGTGLTKGLQPYSPKFIKQSVEKLSDKQRQLLQLRASGVSNKAAASQLDIAPKTVRHYLSDILERLRAYDQVPGNMHAAVAAVWLCRLIEIRPVDDSGVQQQAA